MKVSRHTGGNFIFVDSNKSRELSEDEKEKIRQGYAEANSKKIFRAKSKPKEMPSTSWVEENPSYPSRGSNHSDYGIMIIVATLIVCIAIVLFR